ncbi:hypothetical protein IOD40_12595 [Aquamicrobium sp. cd-1]|uniref:Uncharacterized protein n=2 Tax=Aquamicrobium zhengzhouense TaxID=2781738 RepID=A0ABS0SDY2_9HYPH|nr:hypothetical protein [Aquamicrobium zhengzhouense]
MRAPAAEYREMLRDGGEVVTLKRIVPNQPEQTLATVSARIKGYRPEEVVGSIQAGNRKAILLAEDLKDVSPPIQKNDRLVLASGGVLTVVTVDSSTHKYGTTVLAYVCQVSGTAL